MIKYFKDGLKAYGELCKSSFKWIRDYVWLYILMCSIILIPYVIYWVLSARSYYCPVIVTKIEKDPEEDQ